MTFKISKEFSIGLLVVATIALLFFGINYLKGINLFNPTNFYYAKFKSVNGLVESGDVMCRGCKVGLVKQIIYNYDDPTSDVVVVLQVDNSLKLPRNSRAVLETSMLGGATISLELNQQVPITDAYERGDTIPSFVPSDMMSTVTGELVPRVEEILPHLDSLITALHTLAANKDITESLKHINKMTGNLEMTSAKLNRMMSKDVPPILANANHITTNFSKVSDNLAEVDFEATMNRVDSTLNSFQALADKMNNGKGTIGLLMNDRSLYDGLNTTVGNANNLMIDLKENPKRYVHFSVFAPKEKKNK
jgi:phospholipid/cholesterol/gamma-HCH transport system substrate-binding protein